ncbi:peptidylprolyl isomerase, partial [Pseudomonas helleri]
DSRAAILGDWYQNSGKLKMWMDYQKIDTDTPTGMKLDPVDPKRDFALKLIERTGTLNARPDPINRCTGAYCSRSNIAQEFQYAEQSLS